MSDYTIALQDYHGLRVSAAEKSFLEIFTAKILNAKANKAGIQQEETRLMQEANFRRYGEIVSESGRPQPKLRSDAVCSFTCRYPQRFGLPCKTIFSPLSLQRHHHSLEHRRLLLPRP